MKLKLSILIEKPTNDFIWNNKYTIINKISSYFSSKKAKSPVVMSLTGFSVENRCSIQFQSYQTYPCKGVQKLNKKVPRTNYSAAFSVGILRTLVIKSYGSLRHVSNKTCFAGLALDKRKSSQRKQSRKNVSLLENEIQVLAMAIYRGPHGQVSRQPEPCSSAMLDQKGRTVCCVSCSLWIHTCFLSLRCYGSKTVTIFLYLDISKKIKIS